MKLGKYRFFARSGYLTTFASLDLAINDKISSGLSEHVMFPETMTPDIVPFSGKMVESGANLNRAYFAVDELVKAYDTIPYKPLDLEHDLERIIGHIWSHSYVNRVTNKKLDKEYLAGLSMEELKKLQVDVMIGGITYIDRFPELESPIKRKSYALSMECYFNNYDLILENGVRVTLDEAMSLGLESLIDILMGEFDSEESLIKAHKLTVIMADGKPTTMSVFKYLQEIIFSGVAFVLAPACPSCSVVLTGYDNCDCKEKQAASINKDELPILDLTKLDSYMSKWRDSKEGKPMNVQVKEDLKDKADVSPAMPTGVDTVPNDFTTNPTPCPNYKVRAAEAGTPEDSWCTYADTKCDVAGNRTLHDCLRWSKDAETGRWFYDTRSTKGETDSVEDELVNDPKEEASIKNKYKALNNFIDSKLLEIEARRVASEEE